MKLGVPIILALKNIRETGYLDMSSFSGLKEDERKLILDIYNDNKVDEALLYLESLDADESWRLLKIKLVETKEYSRPKIFTEFLKYAAVLAVLALGYYLFDHSEVSKRIVANDQIELILGNGEVQLLNPEESKQITAVDGKKIGTQNGNEINYSKSKVTKKLVYNTLKIPYGKTFKLKLSDGTMIHLNAGSSLKYPIQFFTNGKREIFLKGEAYFEVSKDKHRPFIVNAGELNIEVLGTSFNISSYTEDDISTTTLVEGAVNISRDSGSDAAILLKPGDQSVLNKNNSTITVQQVDTGLFTNWIDGDLIFRDALFSEIIKTLERTYNVSISNKLDISQFSGRKFNASFNKKNENIEQVLKALNEIQPFRYSINGNDIVLTN